MYTEEETACGQWWPASVRHPIVTKTSLTQQATLLKLVRGLNHIKHTPRAAPYVNACTM